MQQQVLDLGEGLEPKVVKDLSWATDLTFQAIK